MDITIIEEFRKSWLIAIFGSLLFSIGLWLLFLNEGKAIDTAHSLDEALSSVILLNPYEAIKPEYDGRLIHISGNIIIDEPLTEPEYGISIQAVKLKRRVQMYQWVEESIESQFGDTVQSQTPETSYTYLTDWRDKLIDSNHFYIRTGHHNPKEMPIKSHVHISEVVKIGPLLLGPVAKNKFMEFFEVTSDERPERKDIKLHMGLYYHTEDIWNPEVGDIRIQFSYAGPSGQEVTLVALQKNGMLVPYHTSRGHKILMMRPTIQSVEQMFHAEHAEARWEMWKMRAAGWFLLFLSATCLANILRIILSKLPFFQNILAAESPTATNIAVSMSLALVVIGVAWMWYRPMLGAGLFMAAASPFIYCSMGLYNVVQPNGNLYQRL